MLLFIINNNENCSLRLTKYKCHKSAMGLDYLFANLAIFWEILLTIPTVGMPTVSRYGMRWAGAQSIPLI